VASRAAKRRVELDGSKTPPPVARKKAAPRPWWRRGGFWFLVIVLEAVVALIISNYIPNGREEVNLEGGDLVAFCARVQDTVRQGSQSSSVDVAQVADRFQSEADAYRRLSEVAPTDLVPDLTKLADLRTELAAAAREVNAKQIADPRNYNSALADVATAQADAESRGIDANNKVNRYVLRGCGIDLLAVTPVTSTTAPAGTPGTTGTTGGTGTPGTAATGGTAPTASAPPAS
jgi:hypothetical protein